MCYAPTALCRDAVVTMMQTADFWNGDNATGGRRSDEASTRRVFAERKMRSRAQVVSDVRGEHSVKSRCSCHDHMIEALAPNRADDALHTRILPR